MSIPYILNLIERVNDKPGKLIAINDYEVNMKIKRLFYIYGLGEGDNKRGYHGHKNTTQVLIALHGNVTINTKLNDVITEDKMTFLLNSPNVALCIPPNNLIELNSISSDGIILVLCDTTFEEDIYFYPSQL